ncbi:MAG TPA: TRAP transporter substrate-binding protein DctP [Bacteriovoracaceae bacterium]|nr:TRAP transporter substrate-binding protein DctP [Bacteriovoracaceae bacterium]
MQTIALIFVLLLPALSFAAKDVKFGTIAPAGTPWADSLEEIKTRVNGQSKGEMKVKIYLGGQLGGELEIMQKIRRGNIQGGGLTCGAMASIIPELDLLEVPFLFDSSEEADFILDNYLLKPFSELFEKKGFVMITWAENGWRSIGHKTKLIKSPTDLKGVKIRSQESKVHLAFWKKMQAAPVAIAIPEVLPALQTGVVEAFDNTPLFTLAAEWQSAVKFYSVTDHIYQAAAVIYSKKFWDSLKAEEKTTLMGPGNGLAGGIRTNVRKLGTSLLQVLNESGVKTYTLTASEKDAFKKASTGLADEAVKTIGGDAAKLYALIQEGKKAFKVKK